jgi:fluoride exporter
VSWWVWICVALLGGAGAIGRFLLDAVVAARAGRQFPFGTLTVNLTGAFLLGLVTGLGAHGDAEVLAGAATLGSYTTFSTWMLETHRLTEDGEVSHAGLNLAVSLAVGVAAAALGRAIGANT